MKVREILAQYVAALADEGKNAYKIDKQLVPVVRDLGHIDAADLNAMVLETYRKNRQRVSLRRKGEGPPEPRLKPVSQSTLNRELGYLRAALRRAFAYDLVKKVPHFPMRAEGAPRQQHCSAEQLGKILEFLRTYKYRRVDYSALADMVEFAYCTGWRKSEISDLVWREVDLEQRVIALPPERSKNRNGRIFPISGRLEEVMDRRAAARDEGLPYVFHRNGRPLREFRKVWLRAVDFAGATGLTFHGFRNTFATNARRAGVPFDVTMRLAGWKTDSIRRRYAVVLDPELEEAQRQMDEFLEG